MQGQILMLPTMISLSNHQEDSSREHSTAVMKKRLAWEHILKFILNILAQNKMQIPLPPVMLWGIKTDVIINKWNETKTTGAEMKSALVEFIEAY